MTDDTQPRERSGRFAGGSQTAPDYSVKLTRVGPEHTAAHLIAASVDSGELSAEFDYTVQCRPEHIDVIVAVPVDRFELAMVEKPGGDGDGQWTPLAQKTRADILELAEAWTQDERPYSTTVVFVTGPARAPKTEPHT